MLMLSIRLLGPMQMFLIGKWKEIRRNESFKLFMLFPKNCDAFLFWAVYNCNVSVKLLGEMNCKKSHIIYTIFFFFLTPVERLC